MIRSSTPIEVVSAVIVRDGRILLTQRDPQKSFGLLWECPGGKVEPADRTPEDAHPLDSYRIALGRECREELGVAVTVGDLLTEVTVERGVPQPLHFHFFITYIASDARPRAIVAVGIGWHSRTEAISLRMTPGNEAARRYLLERLPLGVESGRTSYGPPTQHFPVGSKTK